MKYLREEQNKWKLKTENCLKNFKMMLKKSERSRTL